jgi:hypothetical protein
MREIQALDPTVDPDQAIRTLCAPAAPAVPKAPAALATPAAAQALKLTDAAGCLGEALCGVPTERNPSTHLYPGLHPGLVCSAPLGHPDESSTALSRLGGATPMCRQRPYLGLVGQPQWIVDGFISAWWGNPLESSMALSWLVEALLSAAWGQAVCAGWAGFGDRLLGGTGCWELGGLSLR